MDDDLKIKYLEELDSLISCYDDIYDLDLSLKKYKAIREVTRRVRRKITEIIVFCPSSFLTLTFNDAVLSNTTEETRRTYVRKFLKSISDNYVANIDYGKKNEREHYHAVVEGQNLDLSAWTYGFIHAQKVGYSELLTDTARLSKYINKLSNHATKETTKRKKIIYSRQ